MSDQRQENANWLLNVLENGRFSTADAQLAVLMDIRDELQKLNRVFECSNFLRLPHDIAKIRKAAERTDKRLAKTRKL